MLLHKQDKYNSHKQTLCPDIPNTKDVVMALSLNEEKKTEHIIIAERAAVERHLAGYSGDDIGFLVNEVRMMGNMISEMFYSRPLDVMDAVTGFWPDTIHRRPDLLEKAVRVVEELYASDNLICRFVALRLWQEYRAVRELPDSREIRDRLDDITYPLRIGHQSQIESWNKVYSYANLYEFLGTDYFAHPAYVMYQNERPLTVFHVTDYSILPLYVHYLNTVYTKHCFFQYCKRCGRMYVAHTTKVKGFCSDVCRKEQQGENRQRYAEKVEGDDAERSYRNTYMYWYNRIKKLRQPPVNDTEKMAEIIAAFESFRTEGTRLKNKVQQGTEEIKVLRDWLFSQQTRLDEMIEGVDA